MIPMINNLRICIYDNGTGIDIPSKIDTYPVEVVLGSTINEVHNNAGVCRLFCVITHIEGYDFIVPTDEDKVLLRRVLRFGNKDYKVDVKNTSMWYNNKASRNIIITDNVKMSSDDLAVILMMYIKEINSDEKAKSSKIDNMYLVINVRNSEEVIRTPNFNEAVRVCNESPCTIILNQDAEVVYKSRYGKVTNSSKSAKSYANVLKSKNHFSNGVFKIHF